MIQDIDEALRTLIRREALPGTDVDIAFDAPTREWSARRNAPTVDLYLYDIREDLQRREVMWQAFRDAEGFVTSRQPPPRHYKLSYLVTAWTQRPEDEHRLLSAVLSCFVRHERLPEDVLTGAFEATVPVFATIALPPPSDRPLSDVWSALGGELKPSLDLVVIAPLVDARVEVPAPPVMEAPRFVFTSPGGPGQTGSAAAAGGAGAAGGGIAAGAGDLAAEGVGGPPPRAGAPGGPGDEGLDLDLDEAAIEAEAQAVAGPNPSPQAIALARQRARARAVARARALARERMLADETVHSGTASHPGRTVRIRTKR
jgi:hypothetical protein